MRVKEVARVKLGSVNKGPAEDFLEDFLDMSEEHPFNDRVRIIGGAAVEASRQGGNVRISDITSLDPRKGHASAAMRLLQKLAKEHGVTLKLTAKAYRDDMMSTEQLVNWYQKLGFEIESNDNDIDNGVDMQYIP